MTSSEAFQNGYATVEGLLDVKDEPDPKNINVGLMRAMKQFKRSV